MPVGGVLYLRVSEKLSIERLADLRDRFVIGAELDVDNDIRFDGLTLLYEDTPYFLPDPAGHWYEANLCMPYYGPGYERGHLPLFLRCAKWLESAVPTGDVWYGNDSSDESIRPFGADVRAALQCYYESVGHEPYRRHFKDATNLVLQFSPQPNGILQWLKSLWR